MSTSAQAAPSPAPAAGAASSRRLGAAGLLLGIALGGFFDGILLHQILQWHHLLSGLEDPPFGDLRVQILMDGLFHAAMYLVGLLGLLLLWRSRREAGAPGADRRLLGNALVGFGLWHVLDAVLSHWLLGIHRVRMEVDSPLLWDLLWFVVFGVAFIAGGLAVRRGGKDDGSDPPAASRGRSAGAAALALAVTVAGPLAALPPPDTTQVVVLFRDDASMQDIFAALEAVDGRMLWSDPSGRLWAFDLGGAQAGAGGAAAFYHHGALLVNSGTLPLACFNWSRVQAG